MSRLQRKHKSHGLHGLVFMLLFFFFVSTINLQQNVTAEQRKSHANVFLQRVQTNRALTCIPQLVGDGEWLQRKGECYFWQPKRCLLKMYGKRATREVLSKNKLVLLGEESFNLQTQFCLMEDVGFHVRKTLLCRSNVITHVFSQVHQLPLLVDGIDLSNLSDTDTVAILLPHITSSSLISSEVYSHAHACLKGYIKGSTAGKHFIDTSISEDWYKLNRISRSISENSMCHVLKESALEDVIFVERAVQNLRARGYLGDIVIRAQPVGSHLLDSVILVRSRMVTLQLITSKVLSTLAAHVSWMSKNWP